MKKSRTSLTLLVLLLGTDSLSSAHQRWDITDKRSRLSVVVPDYDICVVNQTGWIRCARKKLIRERLRPGLSERENRLVMGAIDEINAEAGNSRAPDILVHCMGDWHGVQATVMPAAARSAAGADGVSARSGPMAKERLDAVRSSCTSGGRTAAGERDRWGFRQGGTSVDSFGAAVEACRDAKHSVASQGDLEDPKNREASRPKELKAIPVLDNGSKRNAEEQRKKSQGASGDASAAAAVSFEQSLLSRVRETKAAGDGSPAQMQAIDKAEQTLVDEAQAEAEAELTPEEQNAKQCLVEGQCTERTATVSRPPPGGEDGSTCASRQAQWNDFKRRCDNSDWRSWDCAAFVRLLNRCTDPRLINPGPDGDLICRSRGPSDSAAFRIADRCKKEGMFARYTPAGTAYCGWEPARAMPSRGVDPCRDDLVNPNRDQCPARREHRE